MVSFCDCSDIDSLADGLFLWIDRLIFTALTGAGDQSLCRRISDAAGAFHGHIVRSIDWSAAGDFAWICDGSCDGSV